MSNNCKVKGLLRGLRFISQIFDDKEEEIEIGHPTDVKHVAHIGWQGQGPSESSPSWMNEFKTVPGISTSAPLHINGEIHSDGPDDSVKWVSQDSIRKGSRSVNGQGEGKGLPELPKSSRKQGMGNMRESHAKEKSDRPRQHKKSSKHSQQQPKDTTTTCDGSKQTEQTMAHDVTDSLQLQGSDLHPRTLPDKPTRSRSSRRKDGSNGGGSGSSRSRSRAQPRDHSLDQEHDSELSSKYRNKHRSFEEQEVEGPLQRGSSKQLLTN